MPTDYECLLICRMSSDKESAIFKKLKGRDLDEHNQYESQLESLGWEVLDTSEKLGIGKEHGYFGVAYCKFDASANSVELVIGHRGTCFNEVSNILADISIAKKEEPSILKEGAFRYVETLCAAPHFYSGIMHPGLEIDYGGKDVELTSITHTGFSLGGFIAGACVACTQYPKKAVTFDAPGIGYLVTDEQLRSQAKNKIINYVTRPNLVNTCNEHIGVVRQLMYFNTSQTSDIKFKVDVSDLGFGPSEEFPADECSLTELRQWVKEDKQQRQKQKWTSIARNEIFRTIESHSLDKIMRAINGDRQEVSQWPTADNTILYGEEPSSPSSFMNFGYNARDSLFLRVGYFAANVVASVAQIVKHAGSVTLWSITQEIGKDGEIVGVIGIRHKRNNEISYSDEQTHFLNSRLLQTQAALSSSSPSITTQREKPSVSSSTTQLLHIASSTTTAHKWESSSSTDSLDTNPNRQKQKSRKKQYI